jgi:hypothetical protein
MLRVYYDNVAACGRIESDLQPVEMEGLREIERAHNAGIIKRVTSSESWREQDRTQDPAKRARFETARDELSAVSLDHTILFINHIEGPYGTVANSPVFTDIVDDALFADLKKIGLKDSDAKHLMYAVVNDCDRFVTTDPHFTNTDRRASLEGRCPSIRIVKPSEMAAELTCSGNIGLGALEG